jgi:hypothetical protein
VEYEYFYKHKAVLNQQKQCLDFVHTEFDRKPVPTLAKNLIGKLFGDRGYISKKLTELLATDDVELITTIKILETLLLNFSVNSADKTI